MKIFLLTTPWSYYELRNPGVERSPGLKGYKDVSWQGALPPQGLLQLASVLRKAGHDIYLMDGYLQDIQKIRQCVLKENPQIVGISTVTCLWEKTKVLLREVRKILSESFLLIGGPHATFSKEKCLEESPELNAVVVGEGEWSAREIASRLNSKAGIEGIPGVIFRNGSKIINNSSAGYIQNLDGLPLPAYDLVSFQNYIPNVTFLNDMPFMHIFTSRGCSQMCGFCTYSQKNPLRFKSVNYLIDEIKYLVASLGVKTLNFYDDCNIFSYDPEKAYLFCKLLRKMKRKPQWSIYLVNFAITKEILREMKGSGCFLINCAIESGVQENRDRVRGEKFFLEKIAEKVREISKIGISTCGRFQFGIPGETFKQGLRTIDFACLLPLDYAFFIRALLNPGSKMFEAYLKMNRINPDTRTWNAYVEFFQPDRMTLRDVSALIKIGYKRFYRRSNWWTSRIIRFSRYSLYGKYFKRIMNDQLI